MVIVYRLSPLTYAIGRASCACKSYGMVNLVAGRPIVPELIQDDFTPEDVARETVSLLTDRARADAMRRDLADVRARLGGPGASTRAARAVLDGSRAEARSSQGMIQTWPAPILWTDLTPYTSPMSRLVTTVGLSIAARSA